MAKDYTSTLNLPATSFAMRANLPQREPEMLKYWEGMDLYARLQEQNADKPAFILHDGPPFSNGNIHMGHALNKVLKDFINKYNHILLAGNVFNKLIKSFFKIATITCTCKH